MTRSCFTPINSDDGLSLLKYTFNNSRKAHYFEEGVSDLVKEITVFYSGPVSKEGEGVLQQVEGVEDPHPHPLIEVESLRSLSLNVS